MAWTCPICDRKLKNANAWHYCGQHDLDELFEGKPDMFIYIFDKILAEVYDWDSVSVSATKNCIVFVSTQTFLVIKPMKSYLNVKFYLEKASDHPMVHKIIDYNKRLEHNVRITDIDDLDASLISLIKQSYMLFQK
jgi:hypothetical protein